MCDAAAAAQNGDMGDIVNLRREKKRRAKAEAAQTAAENRVRFGLPPAERLGVTDRAERAARAHDGHRLTGDQAQPEEP